MSDSNSTIRIRHKSLRIKKFCPKCLNELKPSNPFGGWLTPQEYRCDVCGFQGIAALEYQDNT